MPPGPGIPDKGATPAAARAAARGYSFSGVSSPGSRFSIGGSTDRAYGGGRLARPDERFVRARMQPDDGGMRRPPAPFVREDVDACPSVLFDIHGELVRVREVLDEDDGQREEPEE
jgi:hypothetical protein